jgi:hypothetical protein
MRVPSARSNRRESSTAFPATWTSSCCGVAMPARSARRIAISSQVSIPADPSTVPVNNPVNRLGRSGAKSIGRSGAALSAEQAHPPQLNLRAEQQSLTANLESNRESNSSVLTRAHESCGAGAEFRGPVRNAVGSSPISTTASAEEPIQDSCNVNRRPKPERSKR